MRRVPPLATVEIIIANEAGVTDTCPCPIDTDRFAGYQRFARAFPLPLAVRDDALLLVGRSMAVCPSSPACQPLVDLVHAQHVAHGVEEPVNDFPSRAGLDRSVSAFRGT